MNKNQDVVVLRTAEMIDQEASQWLAKLDGENFTATDKKALRQWLALDEAHGKTLKSMATMWGDMDTVLNHVYMSDEEDKTNPWFARRTFFSFRPLQSTLALAALVAISIVFFGKNLIQPSFSDKIESKVYVTQVGDQRMEHFTDGSSAYLNTGSIVQTHYTPSKRIVRLLRGEALFDVAHDKERPFVVYVGNRKVQALGTKFVVQLNSENILVTVTEGRVELSAHSDASPETLAGETTPKPPTILISKGEHIEASSPLASASVTPLDDEALYRQTSWTSGQLVFKNETLEKVVAEVSRYVSTRIVIDEKLREVELSGRFQLGDTKALMEAIELALDIDVNYQDEKIVLQAL